MNIMSIIKKFLQRYVYQDWNIAIAEMNDDLSLKSIRWMKHSYTDRWFADPFILSDDNDTYTILVEEFMHCTRIGRLARLTVNKQDCKLLNNETILDLPTHLSFPNPIVVEGRLYVYPENAAAGNTKYYMYNLSLENPEVLSELPLADPTIFKIEGMYYMFATLNDECNGNRLRIYQSSKPLSGYKEIQQIEFADNTARRAGNMFYWNGGLISPAQICNEGYGKGVCFQKVTFKDGEFSLKDIRRDYPPTKDYPEGYHTFNVYRDNTVVIDGYRYGSKMLHGLYFGLRKFI